MRNFFFFLGGQDLEMVEIAKLLTSKNQPFSDKALGWGAKASAYAEEILQKAGEGYTCVVIELEGDVELPEGSIVVDHHNDRAGEKASILQVLDLLGEEPTRWQLLVATNDSGFIPAMLQIGASMSEVAEVRKADRIAQDITSEQEAEAERAVREREVIGKLTVVRMAHSKSATVTDRLHADAGGAGYSQLLILSSDGEVNFFGDGALCASLKDEFEGWAGGSGLGQVGGNAYWGGYPNQNEVSDFVLHQVEKL